MRTHLDQSGRRLLAAVNKKPADQTDEDHAVWEHRLYRQGLEYTLPGQELETALTLVTAYYTQMLAADNRDFVIMLGYQLFRRRGRWTLHDSITHTVIRAQQVERQ